jgi:hypothetical protein
MVSMDKAERRYLAALRRADSYDDVADAEERLRQDRLAEEYVADSSGMEDDDVDPTDRVPA